MNIAERIPSWKAYPPVPNWYSSNVTAIVEPHLFLYASKNVIVCLVLKDLSYFSSFAVTSEKEKIVAIAAHDLVCFTAGTDKVVRGWNITMGTMITAHVEHKAEVTCLKLIRQGTVLVSGDKSGVVVVVDPYGEKKHVSHKIKSEIVCMTAVTHQEQDYVAIGYANGMIFIEHIATDLTLTTTFQIADDNDTIQSLDWQQLQPHKKMWPLLAASTKRKKSISVWIFPSQNMLCSFKLPIPPAQATEQQKSGVSIQLAWSPLSENRLYVSSYVGAILCYDVSSKPKLNQKARLERHNRNVFTMNWYNGGANCITTSLDKQVIQWDVIEKSVLTCIKAQAMFPYALDTCDFNQGQMAIGMGDNSIKLWNFSNEGSIMKSKKNHDYYSSTVFWKGLQGKIEKIKYALHIEGFIAYSTEYGRVGIYDVLNSKNIPFKSFHKSQTTPSIDWGLDMSQVLEDDDMRDTLLSCGGDGMIHVYDINHPNVAPINLNERLQEKNVSWFKTFEVKTSVRCILRIHTGAKLIAFGHTDGLVEVYSMENLKLIYVSNCQRHAIRALDWKVLHDGKIYLATGCDVGKIAIHELSSIDMSTLPDLPIPQSDTFQLLKSHKRGIADLRWKPHAQELYLASGSDDSLVVIWDAAKGTSLKIFNKHRGKVLSVCWNTLEPYTLFSSSEDRFIYEWKCDQTTFGSPESLSGYKTMRDIESGSWNVTPSRKRKIENKQDTPTDTPSPTTFSLKKKFKKAEDSATESDFMSVAQEAEKATSLLKRRQFCMRLADKIFEGKVYETINDIKGNHLTTTQRKDSTLVRYTDIFDNKLNTKAQPQHVNTHDLFFGDKNDIRQLVEMEVESLNQAESIPAEPSYSAQNDVRKNVDMKLAMEIMQAQYSSFHQERFDENVNSCMSDWIVLALSPMAGKQTWISLMVKQAKKLETLKQYHLSVSCYVACTHIYDAIEVYRKQSMFREAIALAKLRLPPNAPIVDQLFGEWANILQTGDQDALTASCYLMSKAPGSVANAINVLARSGKEDGLFYAACLATILKDGTEEQRIKQWINKMNDRLMKNSNSKDVDTAKTTSHL